LIEQSKAEVVGSTPTRSISFCCTTMVLNYANLGLMEDKFSSNTNAVSYRLSASVNLSSAHVILRQPYTQTDG
jgi:hypothetical protein